jgi:Fe-S cluster biogenesis protein NfuA
VTGIGGKPLEGVQMAARRDAHATGERVEGLLAELRSRAGPQASDTAEELVGCLVELYGAGLTEIVRILGEDSDAGPRLLDRLAADPLVESLLLVHDLHPVDTGTRVQRALDQVRPSLGSHPGTLEYRGIDDEGVVHLRLELSGHGCGSSAPAVREAITEAVAGAAPETAGVDVEEAEAPAELPLLQIMRRPTAAGGAR